MQYPLHILNLPSLQDFNSQVPKDEDLQELDVLRFRPNIISKHYPFAFLPPASNANSAVNGAPAYDEEAWKQVRFKPGDSGLYNDAVFHVSCRTVR